MLRSLKISHALNEVSMMVGEQIRRAGFYLVDFLKGGHVTRHFKDISAKMANNRDNRDVLREILQYAIDHVPYYSNIDQPELHCFPVMKKSIYVNYFQDLQSGAFKEKDLHWVSTSGTIGMPFKSSQNTDKRNRTVADLIYFHQVNGWNIGDKYVFLRAWTTDYIVSKIRKYLQNYVAFDLINFNDEAKEAMRQALITDRKIKIVIGYASGVENFLQYLEKKGDHAEMFHIKGVFTDSDMLSESTKSRLQKMFSCPVINRYSNEEQGVLAYTPPYEDVYRLNTASYHFELLKLDSDEPVGPGETGRVVVTDLYNHSTLFIRYDTNDLAISDDLDRAHLQTLRCLQGRMGDLIKDPDGNMVCETNLSSYFREFYQLRQYQLIQHGLNHYVFKVVCDEGSYSDNDLIDMMQKILGSVANIELQRVDRIPYEKSGKFVTVKNQYKENP